MWSADVVQGVTDPLTDRRSSIVGHPNGSIILRDSPQATLNEFRVMRRYFCVFMDRSLPGFQVRVRRQRGGASCIAAVERARDDFRHAASHAGPGPYQRKSARKAVQLRSCGAGANGRAGEGYGG